MMIHKRQYATRCSRQEQKPKRQKQSEEIPREMNRHLNTCQKRIIRAKETLIDDGFLSENDPF